MNAPDDGLLTPIHIKSRENMPWPEAESVFYTLGANGLFLCRDHEFFRSCVPAPDWPSELAEERTFLEVRYPRVPRRLFELIVGFFDVIGEKHGAEAGVLLVWDRDAQRIRPIVPPQRATVSRSWRGNNYPIGLHYEVPDLPPGWVLIGDVHSHVNEAAYASGTDERDEAHRAGLHIVVGRLYKDPPDLHVAAVVDRTRFRVAPETVLEGYQKRCMKVPKQWIDRVEIEVYGSSWSNGSSTSSWGSPWGKWESPSAKKEDHFFGYPLRPLDPPSDDDQGRNEGGKRP